MEIRIISDKIAYLYFLNKAPNVRCELVPVENNISYIADGDTYLEKYKDCPDVKTTYIGAGNYCISYSEIKLEEQFFIKPSNLKEFLESNHNPWKVHIQDGKVVMEEW